MKEMGPAAAPGRRTVESGAGGGRSEGWEDGVRNFPPRRLWVMRWMLSYVVAETRGTSTVLMWFVLLLLLLLLLLLEGEWCFAGRNRHHWLLFCGSKSAGVMDRVVHHGQGKAAHLLSVVAAPVQASGHS